MMITNSIENSFFYFIIASLAADVFLAGFWLVLVTAGLVLSLYYLKSLYLH